MTVAMYLTTKPGSDATTAVCFCGSSTLVDPLAQSCPCSSMFRAFFSFAYYDCLLISLFFGRFFLLCFSPLTFFTVRFSLVVLWYAFLFFEKKPFSVSFKHRQWRLAPVFNAASWTRPPFPVPFSKPFFSFSFLICILFFCFRWVWHFGVVRQRIPL